MVRDGRFGLVAGVRASAGEVEGALGRRTLCYRCGIT